MALHITQVFVTQPKQHNTSITYRQQHWLVIDDL